jgi:hypothetical protein
MMKIMKLTPRRILLTALGTLAATGGLCAGALASSAYTVKLKLPLSVKANHSFKVTASGTSASTSRLTVFLSKSCASSATAEAKTAHAFINTNVTHSFTSSKSATAPKHTGSYHGCAYLTGGGTTRAHAAKTFYVTIGGY